MLNIVIIYDNTVWQGGLESDWGFSCLIDVHGKKILFDTGANGDILLGNMRKLGISPAEIDMVFISHDHWDHVDGLVDFLKRNNTKVYCPSAYNPGNMSVDLISIASDYELCENVWSTGQLEGIEQSIVIKHDEKVTVITGCSHPGVDRILQKASEFGDVKNLIGGLHGFSDLDLLGCLEFICPTHCTQYRDEIKLRYPEKYIEGGAGRIIYL